MELDRNDGYAFFIRVPPFHCAIVFAACQGKLGVLGAAVAVPGRGLKYSRLRVRLFRR